MFWPAAAFNLTQTAIQCEQQWGVTPRALWAPINLANKVGRAHRTAVEEEGDSTGTQTQTQTHTHTHTETQTHAHTHMYALPNQPPAGPCWCFQHCVLKRGHGPMECWWGTAQRE